MDRPFAIDTDSDVVRGVVMGLAFLVGLALNLDPGRRTLAIAVFGGGAVAFFGLAALAALDDEYAGPQLRWYLFAAWGVLLFSVGVWTESAVGGVGGAIIAVYAALRAWLFDALAEPGDEPEEPGFDIGDGAAARQPAQQGSTGRDGGAAETADEPN
jgi:hypothetical protein